jgi:hypothetical protein
MFDTDAAYLINGIEVDRARNAITLTRGLHDFFREFRIHFEHLLDEGAHTYRVGSFVDPLVLRSLRFPITRTLYIAPDKGIEVPLPQLFAIHRAIAHILHLSATGEYIDSILRDLEAVGGSEDGTTDLGCFVQLRLAGFWVPGVA